MDKELPNRLAEMHEAMRQDAVQHVYYLEVLLPPEQIKAAHRNDYVGARTQRDFPWKGPVNEGHWKVLCAEGLELRIAKVRHVPSALTNFVHDDCTELFFQGTVDDILTLLNTHKNPPLWYPIYGYERQ